MNNLKKIRKTTNKSQTDVSEFLNVARNTYSRYERDVHKMDPDTLKKLSRYFNVSIDYILGNIDEPVTLDELQFLKDLKEKSDDELINTHDIVDDHGKTMSKEDIKKMLAILRAYED